MFWDKVSGVYEKKNEPGPLKKTKISNYLNELGTKICGNHWVVTHTNEYHHLYNQNKKTLCTNLLKEGKNT